MKRLLLALAIGGCAAAPPPQQPSLSELTATASNPVLCYLTFAGGFDAAGAELARRQFVCKDQDVREGYARLQQAQAEQQQMEAQRRSERAAWAALLSGILLSNPPPPPPRPVTCYTFGNRITCQ